MSKFIYSVLTISHIVFHKIFMERLNLVVVDKCYVLIKDCRKAI